MRPRLLVFLLLTAATPLSANDERLISGPGSTLTENKCKICHELQHITRSRQSREQWADTLKLMRERGAPIDDAETAKILEYLAKTYGADRPAEKK